MSKRILFDQNVPMGLRRLFAPHHIVLASELGWARLSNGDLIAEAEHAGFGILMTADRNLRYQQSLAGRRIAIIVLATNRWKTLRDQSDRVILAIDRVGPGSFEEVMFDRPRTRPDR